MQIEKKYASIADFAQAAGISTGTLHAIKAGDSNITIKKLESIATRLNVPVGELLGITNDDWKTSAVKVGIDLNAVDEFIAAPHPADAKTRSIRDYFNLKNISTERDIVRSRS